LYNFVTIAETLIRSVLQELFVVTEIWLFLFFHLSLRIDQFP
jgi:hypothetical protein